MVLSIRSLFIIYLAITIFHVTITGHIDIFI